MIDNKLVPKELVDKLQFEFKAEIAKIFGDNLLFAFIGGGIAKGYADYDHDIDAIVVQKKYNETQAKDYQRFFYALHKKFGFKTEDNPTIDISFGIPADQKKLNNILSILYPVQLTSRKVCGLITRKLSETVSRKEVHF